MNFNLKKPCANCPFRSDKPELRHWLGNKRAQQIADSVFKHGHNFPCHKTTEHDDNGQYQYNNNESQCAGAAIMQIKTRNPSAWMQVAERLGFAEKIKLTNLDLDSSNVFDTPEAFVEFHS